VSSTGVFLDTVPTTPSFSRNSGFDTFAVSSLAQQWWLVLMMAGGIHGDQHSLSMTMSKENTSIASLL
jgi:hypothetical protein